MGIPHPLRHIGNTSFMPSDTRTGMPLHIPGCFDRNITPLMPFGIGGFFVGFWADSRFYDGILQEDGAGVY